MKKLSPLTAKQIWKIERLSGLALSPSGESALSSVTSYSMDKNQGASSLWLLSTTGAAPRRLTRCGDKDGQGAWSPQGDRIAFIGRREQQGVKDTTPQLYVIAPDGGEGAARQRLRARHRLLQVAARRQAHRLRGLGLARLEGREGTGTAPQGIQRAQGKRLRHQRGVLSPLGTTTCRRAACCTCWFWTWPAGASPISSIGSAFELPRDAAGNDVYDISPDGRRIAFAHDPAAVPLASNRLALAEIDLRTRKIETRLDDAEWDFAAPRYSPDGRQLAFAAAHVGLQHTALAEPALLAVDGGWRLLAPGLGPCAECAAALGA